MTDTTDFTQIKISAVEDSLDKEGKIDTDDDSDDEDMQSIDKFKHDFDLVLHLEIHSDQKHLHQELCSDQNCA